MIDTHAHLHLPDFDHDRECVVIRDFALGLTGILEVSISANRWSIVKLLAEGDRRILATAGVHPHEAARETAPDLRALEKQIHHSSVVAIGETGIDTYRDYAPLEDQRKLFAAQVRLARESGLPLVIHCREAFQEVFSILDREGRGEVRGVFHCFSGDLTAARQVLARGFAVGLGGAVTYAPERWRPLLRSLPLESLLLETDCPYLRPAPDRGGRNEPALVFHTAQVVAELLGIDPGELERIADRNAAELFGFSVTARDQGAGVPGGQHADRFRDSGA